MTTSLKRLRAFAARLLDRRTIERIIDPLLTDVQTEHEKARQSGHSWLSRWTLIAGHVVFLKTFAVCEAEEVMSLSRDWSAADRATFRRTLRIGFAAIAIGTIILELPPLISSSVLVSDPAAILLLTPQALVLAVPVGFTIGTFYGLRDSTGSPRSRMAVFACAIVASLTCLALLVWILPWANQEFRQIVFGHRAGYDGVAPTKGLNELTLAELSARMAAYRRTGTADWDPRLVAYSYHQRWALSCATVTLVVFALATARRMVKGWTAALAALVTLLLYYVLLWTGRGAVLQLNVPAFDGAWFPNALFAIACAVVLVTTSRQARSATTG